MGVEWAARGGPPVAATLAELALLAQSAGARVVASVLQARQRPDAATFVGRGKLEELQRTAEEQAADLVIFDEELTPAQQRNIEKVLGRKTLDRTQLILDIFARRARTREGRLQVELAQLDYLLPRLAGKGIELSRLGGGIGTRGPGETKLESDRRRIRQRIQALKREIEHVRRARGTRRSGRQRAGAPVVALVGYTNAGKSTLFNALSRQSAAAAADQLFMTLDPLVRRARLGPAREALLVDTVGFIQKLPHALVAAFRATLEEVVEADLLLHVVDASAEDRAEREAAVLAVLHEIGAGERPRLEVFNKIDRVAPEHRATLAADETRVAVSALSGAGLDELRARLVARLELDPRAVRLRFPAADAAGIGSVYTSGRVTAHEVSGDEVHLVAELPARLMPRFQAHLVDEQGAAAEKPR